MPRDPRARIASSPVSAARLARETRPIALTPARQIVLLEAAALWCRDLVFPTARRLAQSVDCAPSTVLNGFETMARIHAEVIRREWDVLCPYRTSTDLADLMSWLIDHLRALSEIDRAMLRLPSLVDMAVGAATVRRKGEPLPLLSVAVNVVTAFADPATVHPEDAQLSRIIRAVLHAIDMEAKDGDMSEKGRAA